MVWNFGFVLHPVAIGGAAASIAEVKKEDIDKSVEEQPKFPQRIPSESTPEKWICVFRLILQSTSDHQIVFEIVSVPEGQHMIQFRKYDVGFSSLIPRENILFTLEEFGKLLLVTDMFKKPASTTLSWGGYEFGLEQKGEFLCLFLKPSDHTETKIFVLPEEMIKKLQKPDLRPFFEGLATTSNIPIDNPISKTVAERTLTWTALYHACKELEISMGIKSVKDGGLIPISDLQKVLGKALNKIDDLKESVKVLASIMGGCNVTLMDDSHYIADVLDILINANLETYDSDLGTLVFMLLESIREFGTPRVTAKCGYPV